MHHFIYPSQDTFITDTLGFDNLNFGLDETLRVGTQVTTTKIISPTTTYTYPTNTTATNLCVQGFSGSVSTSSLYGSASFIVGTISNSSIDSITFSTDYFSGSISGSLNGWLNGNPYSASIGGNVNKFSGSIVVNGFINGFISGSLVTSLFETFNGSLTGFTGKFLSSSISGIEILPQQNTTTKAYPYKNRALIQFDISSISQSIVNGDIKNPEFKLKLYVARECNLPINYKVYAFPVSESWVMGNGYISDNGSTLGASWIYRDSSGGTPWATTGSSYIQLLSATQSFSYQVGDINMNVTPVVNAWLSQSIPNNGFVLVSSDEFDSQSYGMGLYFFSKDTNTIYEPVLDVGWNDVTWSTGSVTTASANISTVSAGLLGTVSDMPTLSGSIYGGFEGIGNIFTQNLTASGLIDVYGTSGLITSMSIVGNMSGSVSHSIVTVYNDCNSCNPSTFYYTPCSCNTSISGCPTGSMITMSYLMGTLIDGTYSGSIFTASWLNNYQLHNGYLEGNWNQVMIIGTTISSSYPLKPMYPSAVIVGFRGLYVNGDAFGTITALSASYGLVDYGIFDGVFIDGPLAGSKIHAPFTGSILSSSYSYTSSLNLDSSSLIPIDANKAFTITLQNIQPIVKAGDILRINVFARASYPLKNFNKQTQLEQFLIPQYLPQESYYAIKDNETEQTVIKFDQYTKLSCDKNGNFFNLDTTGLPQERYFKILIRTEQDGNIYTFDKNAIFKIVR